MSGMVCAHCGAVNEIEKKVRSRPQLNRYFGVIGALYRHWPDFHLVTGEAVEFIPENERHLRKWLQVEAGLVKVSTIPVASDDPEVVKIARIAAEGAVRAVDDYVFIRPQHGSILVFSSLSIQYVKLGHKKFCELNNKVDEVIWAKTGHDPEQLLREHRRAA